MEIGGRLPTKNLKFISSRCFSDSLIFFLCIFGTLAIRDKKEESMQLYIDEI